jgi:hypothetical protein
MDQSSIQRITYGSALMALVCSTSSSRHRCNTKRAVVMAITELSSPPPNYQCGHEVGWV